MGWARTLLLGDIGNRLDIEDTERDIASMRSALGRQRHTDASQDLRIARLEEQVQQLSLAVTTLTRLLVKQRVLDSEDIESLASLLEREDAT